MKCKIIIVLVALTCTYGWALAQSANCAGAGFTRVGTGVDLASLANFLRAKTVCAQRGNDRWQEYHHPNGNVIDYKRGPSDPVDPTTTVDGWSTTAGADAIVTYDYRTGGIYSYSLWSSGATGTYTFCGVSPAGNDISGATFSNGQVSCQP